MAYKGIFAIRCHYILSCTFVVLLENQMFSKFLGEKNVI